MTPLDPDRLAGLLLGTAVGDALGLPAEGLSPGTIGRLGWKGNWRHRLVAGRGMWSDDTEHTIMLAQALLGSGGEPRDFGRRFAWELRWWLLGLPAGVGLATARSLGKLWLGFPTWRSGVFSAGNGPCMRAAIVGACFPHDAKLRYITTAFHTRTTHTDPKALTAALALADLAALLGKSEVRPSPGDVREELLRREIDAGWRRIVEAMDPDRPLDEFLEDVGIDPKRGIGGYAYHTVPAVVFLGMRNRWDFETTLAAVLDAGGDTDSAGAIAGALCGVFGGKRAIPERWVTPIAEWPTSVSDLERLARALHENRPLRIRPRWSPLLLLRNLGFLMLVLTHGFPRLLPARWRRDRPGTGPASA